MLLKCYQKVATVLLNMYNYHLSIHYRELLLEMSGCIKMHIMNFNKINIRFCDVLIKELH